MKRKLEAPIEERASKRVEVDLMAAFSEWYKTLPISDGDKLKEDNMKKAAWLFTLSDALLSMLNEENKKNGQVMTAEEMKQVKASIKSSMLFFLKKKKNLDELKSNIISEIFEYYMEPLFVAAPFGESLAEVLFTEKYRSKNEWQNYINTLQSNERLIVDARIKLDLFLTKDFYWVKKKLMQYYKDYTPHH